MKVNKPKILQRALALFFACNMVLSMALPAFAAAPTPPSGYYITGMTRCSATFYCGVGWLKRHRQYQVKRGSTV